jgi:hypothetical protein
LRHFLFSDVAKCLPIKYCSSAPYTRGDSDSQMEPLCGGWVARAANN